MYRIQWVNCGHFELLILCRGCPHGAMVKTMDCGIIVSEFKLQSSYYIHFWTNTLFSIRLTHKYQTQNIFT